MSRREGNFVLLIDECVSGVRGPDLASFGIFQGQAGLHSGGLVATGLRGKHSDMRLLKYYIMVSQFGLLFFRHFAR